MHYMHYLHFVHYVHYMRYMHYMHYMHSIHYIHCMHCMHYMHYMHYIPTFIHTYVRMYVRTYVRTCVRAFMHAYIRIYTILDYNCVASSKLCISFCFFCFLFGTCPVLWWCFSNLTSQSCVSAFGTSAKFPCLICELWLPATFCILGCSSLCGRTCTMKASAEIAEALNLEWGWNEAWQCYPTHDMPNDSHMPPSGVNPSLGSSQPLFASTR